MTLSDMVAALEGVASVQPNVRTIVQNDIFRLNSRSDVRYGVFGWTQGQHVMDVEAGTVSYVFTLFYIDRLTEDQGNRVEVQSVGMQTLGNIVTAMDEAGLYIDGDCTMQTFSQRFLDECAGVFTGVTVTVPLDSLCAETFDIDNDVEII